jgi:hypothetical protein
MNYEKNPNELMTGLGMMRGSAAVGNIKEALKFGEKMLAEIKDDDNTKAYVEKLISDLKAGKDINN